MKTLVSTNVQPANLSKLTAIHAQTQWGSGRGGRPWRRLRQRILLRDQYRCQCGECGGSFANEVDHIIPLAQGGTDHEANLRAMNTDCHKRKTQQEANGRGA